METKIKGFFLLGMIVSCIFLSKPVQAAEIEASSKQSLQTIIDRASPGDVIMLQEGRYEGALEITKPLTIKGEEGTIIDGGGKGHVITIQADQVTIEGVAIQKSGTGKNESAVYINGGRNVTIKDNKISDVMYGIYVQKGENHRMINNSISSYNVHFSKRGSGIHLYYGEGHLVKGNMIMQVQDGVYLDHTKSINVEDNDVMGSRYGFHFMFSDDIHIEKNNLQSNITGLMIMDSSNSKIIDNSVTRQFHVRGFGILIYDSSAMLLENNDIKNNSTGLSLEKTVDVEINRNIISGNQLGLEFIGINKNNIFTENNFIGNVVQSKITNNKMKLDNGTKGNYWDDYSSYDVTGDGVGEITYKAGSLYDQLLSREPYWQFFFESPSIKLWSKAETLFPSIGVADVYDDHPLVEPVKLSKESSNKDHERNIGALILAVAFLWFSILVIWLGRSLS